MRFILIVIAILLLTLGFMVTYAVTNSDAHVAGCHTTKCDRRIHERRAAAWCKRHPMCVWKHRWQRLSAADRNYADAVFGCEKGDQPGDHSSFIFRGEWTWGTWHAAGGGGYYPSYYEEAWRVVVWTRVVGYHSTRGWPNCP